MLKTLIMNRILHVTPCVLLTFLIACNQPPQQQKQARAISIQNHGVHIDYTDRGTGDTTLFFVHGWCINKTYWNDQVDFFSKKYRVVTMDLPGFGRSGKNRKSWTTATFATDVDSVMAALHLKNVILVGHSMAGDIILQATFNMPDPVIALVGIDNFKSVGIQHSARVEQQNKQDYANAIEALKHHFKATAFMYFNEDLFYKTTDINIRRRILNDVAHADSTIATACMENDNFDEAGKLLAAKKKLCLINSDVNPTDTTGLHARHIPFKLFYIHATGHFPMVEDPKNFNALLEKAVSSPAP